MARLISTTLTPIALMTKKIDLGKVNDEIFSLFASIGAVPEAIHEVTSEEKSKFGGLAYIKKSLMK